MAIYNDDVKLFESQRFADEENDGYKKIITPPASTSARY